MNVVQASILSQGIYGFFAQNRDLVYDLMKGEGWNTPVEIPSTTTDTSSINSITIVTDVKSSNVADTSVEVSSVSTTENSEKNSVVDATETSIIVSAPHSSDTSSEVSTE